MTEFNKGWWNCFCSFANNSYETREDNISACIEILRGAGVTISEIEDVLSREMLYGEAVNIVQMAKSVLWR